MAREVHFGYDCNISVCSISDNLAYLLLGVEPSVRSAVIYLRTVIEMPDECFFPYGTDFCQFRIAHDFHSPALVVGYVPVQAVHIVQGHHVDIFLDLLHCEEVPAYIEMRPPVSEFRGVLNPYGRKQYFVFRCFFASVTGDRCCHGFPYCLYAIEDACGCRGGHFNPVLPGHYGVALFRRSGIPVQQEQYHAALNLFPYCLGVRNFLRLKSESCAPADV